jgi:transposase
VFVQETKSGRGKKKYVSYLVRESFRTPEGPRSRTVCNITGLPPEVRDLIAGALRGQTLVPAEQLALEKALSYGGLAVLRDAWSRFGLESVLEGIPGQRERQLIQAMIFGRLLFPCAKLALAQQAEGTLLAQACGLPAAETFDEDDLYAAMDQFNGRWVPMEKALYQKAFPEQVRLVLYDLTSVYFEGQGPGDLGRYGHSRDHRPDRRQIILAVATDLEGTPIHLEVLRGNRADNTTLGALFKTMQRRFGIKEAMFVFDGGMSSRLNLEALSAARLRYVTRLSSASLTALLESLPTESQPELGDRNNLVELEQDGKRYVIAGGPWRQQRDQERRQARVAKAELELKRLAAVPRKTVNAQKLASQVGRMLERKKAHKYFNYRVEENGQLHWERKKEIFTQEERPDGWYLLHTNASADQAAKEAVLTHYKGLLNIEEAFGELKSYLEVRPVFHRRPDRVRNHVRICFLAYWLSARLGREWRAAQEPGEVPRILRELQNIRVGQVSAGGQRVATLLTEIPPRLNAQLIKLNLLKLFAQPPAWAAL